jgi:hypothetical protein
VIKRVKTGEDATPAVPISEARRRLFALVEEVLTGRADRVALSHKGYDERVLLVRARDLTKLEADLAALRGRLGPEPRPLRGLAQLHVQADDVLAGVRGRQTALAATKRDAWRRPADAVDSPTPGGTRGGSRGNTRGGR